MEHKILSQGALDGTCFLYAIMNAYKTLVFPELNITDFISLNPKEKSGRGKWEYIVRTCPQTLDMLVGNGFPDYISEMHTKDVDKIVSNQYKNTLTTAFEILSDTTNEFSVAKINIDDIATFNFTKSVIILPIVKRIKAIRGNDIEYHFICINGKTDDSLHIMCSYTIHKLPPGKYFESFDQTNKRYYNNLISLADVNRDILAKGIDTIYQISKLQIRLTNSKGCEPYRLEE